MPQFDIEVITTTVETEHKTIESESVEMARAKAADQYSFHYESADGFRDVKIGRVSDPEDR